MNSMNRKKRVIEYMKESASMILDTVAADYFQDELGDDDFE